MAQHVHSRFLNIAAELDGPIESQLAGCAAAQECVRSAQCDWEHLLPDAVVRTLGITPATIALCERTALCAMSAAVAARAAASGAALHIEAQCVSWRAISCARAASDAAGDAARRAHGVARAAVAERDVLAASIASNSAAAAAKQHAHMAKSAVDFALAERAQCAAVKAAAIDAARERLALLTAADMCVDIARAASRATQLPVHAAAAAFVASSIVAGAIAVALAARRVAASATSTAAAAVTALPAVAAASPPLPPTVERAAFAAAGGAPSDLLRAQVYRCTNYEATVVAGEQRWTAAVATAEAVTLQLRPSQQRSEFDVDEGAHDARAPALQPRSDPSWAAVSDSQSSVFSAINITAITNSAASVDSLQLSDSDGDISAGASAPSFSALEDAADAALDATRSSSGGGGGAFDALISAPFEEARALARVRAFGAIHRRSEREVREQLEWARDALARAECR